MGKNNQQRRAAKRRLRAANVAAARGAGQSAAGKGPAGPARPPGAQEGAPPESPWSLFDLGDRRAQQAADSRGADPDTDPPTDIGDLTADLIDAGADVAFGEGSDDAATEEIVQALVVATADRRHPDLAARLATRRLLELIGVLWEHGWQPLDLTHIVRRHQSSRQVALVAAVICDQARRVRAADRAPAEWAAQLTALAQEATGAAAPSDDDWLITEWQLEKGIGAWDGWRDILLVIGQLKNLHGLTPLLPPPSAWDRPTSGGRRAAGVATGGLRGPGPASGHGNGHDPRMLTKIRALLSKAEASTFAEEAEAFTSKAQDLMTRYAIDEALLADSEGDSEVISRRVHIDNPYAQAKVQLLSTVGVVNRVRVVWDDRHGMATTVGMALDLQLVEMLFTSLLVQATRALNDAGKATALDSGYRGGRTNRSPSFRRAFLLAYANRIGERLAEAGERASHESAAGHGAELVPVLARRAEAVDRRFDRLFPQTRQIRAKQVDARGWHAGRAAADKAVFASGQVGSG